MLYVSYSIQFFTYYWSEQRLKNQLKVNLIMVTLILILNVKMKFNEKSYLINISRELVND